MKILSLFNGISCGRVALERANISVEKYVSYEIDKYANQVAQNNYPNDTYLGNVCTADFTQYKGFDLLIGGSPCTYWSIAKKGRETTSDGVGYQLFMQFVRAYRESGCTWFLYENNFSIHKDIKAAISQELGVEPIMINSALVSAQNRKRCYWTNIPNVGQPEDRVIVLRDILESGQGWQDKSYCVTASYDGAIVKNTLERKQRTMIAEPIRIRPNCELRITKNSIRNTNLNGKGTSQGYTINYIDGKSSTVIAGHASKMRIILPYNCGFDATGVATPVYIGELSRAEGQYRNGKQPSQQNRIYSVHGKSVCVDTDSRRHYKIDLPDGDYIIRKLTPIECERLQTLPDNYTAGVSNTQRYKAIGNGWTVDVIAHILRGLKEE